MDIYIYIRFSDEKQELGTSYDRQLSRAHAYCRANSNEIPPDSHIYFDSGKSAYKDEQLAKGGELRRFYDDVANGTVAKGSLLLVENLDRLSRADMWRASDKLRELIDSGIVVVTLDDNKRYSGSLTLADGITSLIKQELANDESKKKADRVKRSWAERYKRARNGLPIKVPLASWLQYGDDGFTKLKEPEAEAVRLIFQLCVSGAGMLKITQELNRRYRPFRGEKWITASVMSIVRNKAAIGVYSPRDGGDPVEDYFAPVVNKETWWAAQGAINSRKLTKATNQTQAFNVWQGIAKCGHCNSALHCLPKGRNGQHYLVCSGKIGGVCKKAKNVRLDKSEEVYRELLAQVDSLSLVQTAKTETAAKLSVVTAQLLHERQQQANFLASLEESYSKHIDDLARKAESKIYDFLKQKDDLERGLADEQAKQNDKAWFLEKLDLCTYEKRQQANSLLKSLKITACVFGGPDATYVVRNGNQKDVGDTFKHPNGKAILQICFDDSRIVVLPLTDQQRSKNAELDLGGQDRARSKAFIKRKLGI
jgi:DNA invertase Pin-like site-specific DNA recombinase